VWLGGEIQVKVLAVRSGFVRLGIEAPQAVEVLREAPVSDGNADGRAVKKAASS